MRCETDGEHTDQEYFLALTDSQAASNGIVVCSNHLLSALDLMLQPPTVSVDVQKVTEVATAYFFSTPVLTRDNPAKGHPLKALRVQVYPEYAAAYNNRGIAYRSLGQQERAIEDYNEALRLNPQNLLPYTNRGAANSRLGTVKL